MGTGIFTAQAKYVSKFSHSMTNICTGSLPWLHFSSAVHQIQTCTWCSSSESVCGAYASNLKERVTESYELSSRHGLPHYHPIIAIERATSAQRIDTVIKTWSVPLQSLYRPPSHYNLSTDHRNLGTELSSRHGPSHYNLSTDHCNLGTEDWHKTGTEDWHKTWR